MLLIVIALVVGVITIMVASLLSGMTFKQFIEIAVATATIAGVIIAAIGFYYKGKEKKISSSMDRVLTVIDRMNDNPDLQCIWEGNSNCDLNIKAKLDLIVILKNLDAALYTERTDESIHFIMGKMLSSPVVRGVWYKNRVFFSTKFNNYVSRL